MELEIFPVNTMAIKIFTCMTIIKTKKATLDLSGDYIQ